MADWTYYVVLLGVMIAGLFLNILGLPGLWVLVAGVAGYAWLTGGAYIGLWGCIVLVLLGIVAEVVETLAGGAGASKAGGGKRSVLGAIIGGLVGGIVGTGLIPVPIVGTLVGLCAGAFIGAAILEHSRGKGHEHTLRVGWGAAKGRLFGTLAKTAIGLVMLVVAGWLALPTGRVTAAAVPVLPSTQAVTTTTAPMEELGTASTQGVLPTTTVAVPSTVPAAAPATTAVGP